MTAPLEIGRNADGTAWVTELGDRYVEPRLYTDGSTCAIAITGTRIAFLRSCVNWTFTDQTRGGGQGRLT